MGAKEEREERLGAALRENLRRRKAHGRDLKGQAEAAAADTAEPKP